MASAPATEVKELELIGKVELRIAIADSDKKLENLLKVYLAPLLLKLASDSVAVRNKVISICQHINTRIKPQEIKLPVAALLKQFKEQSDVPLIRHFDVLYIQQGISRLPVSERLELLPIIIRGISVDYSKSALHASQLFHLLLRLLTHFKLPLRGTKEDSELRASLNLEAEDAEFLSHWFGKLILLSIVRQPGNASGTAPRCPGLSVEDYKFLTIQGKPEAWDPNADSGLNLAETKVLVARFLTSGMFTDEEKFFPALFASADTNSRVSDVGEDILKRVLLVKNVEDPKLVESLLDIYFGSTAADGALPARVPLKIKILNVLSKSVAVTTYPNRISKIVQEGLLSNQQNQTSRTSLGREASKFRSAIFALINFVARRGAANHLAELAEAVGENLRLFIEDQGWPKPDSDQDPELRGYAYETIGLLAKAAPSKILLEPSLSLLEWLFRSLREDPSGKDVAVSIEEALSSVLNAFTGTLSPSIQSRFRTILLKHASYDQPSQTEIAEGTKFSRSTRYVATRFANRCLPFHDVAARWIDILSASGGKKERHEVIEEGKKGLDPYWYTMLNSIPGAQTDNERLSFPQFHELVEFTFNRRDDGEDVDMDIDNAEDPISRVRQFKRRYPDAFPLAITFCTRVLMQSSLESHGLDVDRSVEWERKMEILVSTDQRARQAIKAYTSGFDHPESLSTILRGAFERVVQDESAEIGEMGTVLVDLCTLCPEETWITADLTADFRTLEPSILSNNLGRRIAACHSYGMIASHESCNADEVEKSLSLLFEKAKAWKTAMGADINQASGALLALAYYFSRAHWRQSKTIPGGQQVSALVEILFDILKNSQDATLKESVHLSIEQWSLFHVLEVSKVSEYMSVKDVVDKIYDTAKTGNAKAILALGHFAMLTEEPNDTTAQEETDYKHVAEKLYELHEIRQPEVQFSVGEALSCFACGWESKALISALDIEHPNQSHEQWDSPLQTPTGPKREKTLAMVLERTLTGCRNTKPALKKASVIWLLCLLQYCGYKPEIQEHLPQCQTAFKMCLSDRDEVVQEAASRGLGLVYEKGDRQLKDELVRDLVGSFSDNRSKMSGSVTEDTQLFEPGALPTGDGSITTYKDILNLAAEVGDSSLVYRFMSLAANNSIWSSRAAFGRFGLSNIFSDSSVDGYLAENPKLYPKLYRYRFDPNPNVQRSMNDIWNALVKDSSATIDKHFDAIMDDLLTSILTKEWRVRQASCAAIGDLVQGRTPDKYEKYLSQIWDKTFKVLDDIKESVRTSAASLARILTGILTRNLESSTSSTKNASAMLSRVLPFLLSTSGLESSAEEVRAFALHTLLQIIKKSTAKTLRPHIPSLVEKLLGLLSILEPEAINYIHLNASKYNLTEQKIDDMRLQSVRSSPLTESIDRCLDLVDAETMKELIPHIEKAIKNAVGLPSKVGCSRILVTLSTRHGFQFKPYADGFLKLIEKYIHDRNETVASSYGAAAGYVARLATEKQLLATIAFCQRCYFESEDDKWRLAAGDIVMSMSKHAADRFSALSSALLPFVFLAKHDGVEQVKKLFGDTWSDNVGGSRAVLLYFTDIIALAEKYLDSAKWGLKHAAARTVADAVISITPGTDEISKANAEVVWSALDKAMGGKTWEGKEVVLEAFVRFVERGRALWGSDVKVATQIEKVAIREAKRGNKEYRPHALEALGKIAKARTDIEICSVVEEIVGGVVDEVVGEDDGHGDKMDVDGGDVVKEGALKEKTLAVCPATLLSSINTSLLPPTAITTHLSSILPLISRINSTHAKNIHLATFVSLNDFFTRLPNEVALANPDIKHALETLLFDTTYDGLPEAMRLKRAEALVVVAKTRGCEWVGEKVRGEIEGERSGGVRGVLGKVGKE